MARKQFSGGAAATTLTAGISSSDLSITVASGTNYPDGSVGVFVVVLGRGTANEEKVLCTGRSGNNITIDPSGRGYDGTSAGAWGSGTTVVHCLDATTLTDLSGHVYDTTRDDHTQYARIAATNTFTAKQTFSAGVGSSVDVDNEVRARSADASNQVTVGVVGGGLGAGVQVSTGTGDWIGRVSSTQWQWRIGGTTALTVTNGLLTFGSARLTADPGAGVAGTTTFTNGGGIGNGTVAALTAPAVGTGTGPTTLQAATFIKVYYGGAVKWIPAFD